MGGLNEALKMLDDAVGGSLDEQEAARMLEEFGADEELMSRLGIRTGMKVAGTMDWLFEKCRGNKALLIGSLALLVSAGRLHGYEVQSGDTLWGIARASNCKVEDLRRLNPQISGDVIREGDNLVTPSEVKPGSNGSVHVVAKGDTLGAIAKKYNTTVDNLLKLNPQIKDRNRISVGDEIVVSEEVKIDPKADYIAKVLYAETSTRATENEVGLICRVILNRIGNKAFGGASDAYGVVTRKGAFSCTSGNDGNVNWDEYSRDLNDATLRDYGYAEKLVRGDSSGLPGSDDIVYYCNKSLAKKYAKPGEDYGYPPGWESGTWQPVLENITEHFCFYRVEKK